MKYDASALLRRQGDKSGQPGEPVGVAKYVASVRFGGGMTAQISPAGTEKRLHE